MLTTSFYFFVLNQSKKEKFAKKTPLLCLSEIKFRKY